MKLGAVFPQLEIGSDPAAIRDYVQAVEGMGFDYLLAYEHILGADPADYPERRFAYGLEDMFHEPFVLFGFMAGLTTRLEFATGILILPQRNTAVVAKQAAEVDVLTGGRLRLGVGVGWNQAEMEAVGYRFENRGRRVDEQLTVLQRLWSEPRMAFEGEFHHIPGLGINPLPVQRPIPLWFGGAAEPVLRRMARFGAGWMPNSMTPDSVRSTVETIHELLRQQGRNPAEFGIDARITPSRQPQDTWTDTAAGWRALGATHLCCNTMDNGFTSVDEHLAELETFKAEVG